MTKRKQTAGAGRNKLSAAAVKVEPLSAGIGLSDEKGELYRLMTWLSPSFPIGAFSYSSGIEWAVETGDIRDPLSLEQWLDSMIANGAGYNDGVFLSHTHRYATTQDMKGLWDVYELAFAFVSSRERQLETLAQGRAFITAIKSAWPSRYLDGLLVALGSDVVYPVAVGLVSASHGLSLEATLHAFLHAQVANWISAATRLVPLGQTDSQRVLAALENAVVRTGQRVLNASLDDLGSATFRADIASMKHETQYTRLFRS
jgi:urease accessory protein